MPDQGRIFISYVREDGERVDRLQEQLETAGPTYRDIQDIWPGDVWKRELEEAIRADAMAFVPCFSDATVARDRSVMFEELTWAAEEYRRRNPDRPWIFPVLFDNVEPPSVDLGAGRTLSSLQWTRLYDDWDTEVERLVTALRELLSVEEPTTVSEIELERTFADLSVELGELEREGRAAIAVQHATDAGSFAASLALPFGTANPARAELLSAAQEAQLTTFGWPIGIVLEEEDWRPAPTADGIRAEVQTEIHGEPLYDLWKLDVRGTFLMVQSLFEDQRGRQGELWFDTRIARTTELLLFGRRLYAGLGVRRGTPVAVTTRYSGLDGRRLSAANSGRRLRHPYVCSMPEAGSRVEVELTEIDDELGLVRTVKDLLAPVFELFDFFTLADTIYEELVTAFASGRVG